MALAYSYSRPTRGRDLTLEERIFRTIVSENKPLGVSKKYLRMAIRDYISKTEGIRSDFVAIAKTKGICGDEVAITKTEGVEATPKDMDIPGMICSKLA